MLRGIMALGDRDRRRESVERTHHRNWLSGIGKLRRRMRLRRRHPDAARVLVHHRDRSDRPANVHGITNDHNENHDHDQHHDQHDEQHDNHGELHGRGDAGDKHNKHDNHGHPGDEPADVGE